MRKTVRPRLHAIIVMTLVANAACTTRIHQKDATIQPSKVPFSSYTAVAVRPLIVERSDDDPGDRRAVDRVKNNLDTCFQSVFRTPIAATAEQSGFAAGTLVIEPAIEDLKKINVSERFWVGPLAGSSAILLRTRYRDGATGEVIASPVFYSKANAMGGAFTVGATDNLMLNRVVELACDYARRN